MTEDKFVEKLAELMEEAGGDFVIIRRTEGRWAQYSTMENDEAEISLERFYRATYGRSPDVRN